MAPSRRAARAAAISAAVVGGIAVLSSATPITGPTIPRIFSNEMVLQRAPASAGIWGWSAPGDVVNATVTCGTNTSSAAPATAGADGFWSVSLPPQEANTGTCELHLNSADWEVWYIPVHFGDVYFCAGQSNMHVGVDYAFNGTEEVARVGEYQQIRYIQLSTTASGQVPFSDVQVLDLPWTAPDAVTLPDFSAVCWYHGRHLADSLGPKIPIGLIQASWPSTFIRNWSPPEVIKACPNDTPLAASELDVYARGSVIPRRLSSASRRSRRAPSSSPPPPPSGCGGDSCEIFNSFIAPWTFGPLSLTGFIYYQGETDRTLWQHYFCALPHFLTAIRTRFASPTLWAAVVQLHPWVAENGTDVGNVRLAQANATASLSNVSMIVLTDNGDPLAPAGSIHPRDKNTVGRRLSWQALAAIYGNETSAPYVSPAYASASVNARPVRGGSGGTTLDVTVHFRAGTVTGGLQPIAGAHCPTELGVPVYVCGWIEVQASDGVWYNVTAPAIGGDGTSLVLSVDVPTPGATVNATRFGLADYPVVAFANGLGLPLAPWSEVV